MKKEEAVCPPPGQLCSQLSDLQGELQVHVLTLSHCPEQTAVLLTKPLVSVLQFSHGSQQVLILTEHKQTV